jgi:hypothetical protein
MIDRMMCHSSKELYPSPLFGEQQSFTGNKDSIDPKIKILFLKYASVNLTHMHSIKQFHKLLTRVQVLSSYPCPVCTRCRKGEAVQLK